MTWLGSGMEQIVQKVESIRCICGSGQPRESVMYDVTVTLWLVSPKTTPVSAHSLIQDDLMSNQMIQTGVGITIGHSNTLIHI